MNTNVGRYLYDLSTGRTIGIQQQVENRTKEEEQVSNLTFDTENTSWSILGNTDISSSGNYGSVAQLDFEMIVELFLNGNLIPEELQTGLEAKGVTDLKIEVSEDGKMVHAEFTYNNKTYKLSCSTAAAESQLDNITFDGNVEQPRTQENEQAYANAKARFQNSVYYGHSNDRSYETAGCGSADFLTDLSVYSAHFTNETKAAFEKYNIPSYITDLPNPYAVYEQAILVPKLAELFGISYEEAKNKFFRMNGADFTEEERKKINENIATVGLYYMNTNSSSSYTIDANGAFSQWLLENYHVPTPEEGYINELNCFKFRIEEGRDSRLAALEMDGDVVRFKENAAEIIKNNFDPNSDLYKAIGITANDDIPTIEAKIKAYCNKLGSEDGNSVYLEDLYNSLGCYRTLDDFRESYAASMEALAGIQELASYGIYVDYAATMYLDQLRADLAEARANHANSQGTRANAPANNNINAGNSSDSSNVVTLDSSNADSNYNVKQEKLDEFADKIKNTSEYGLYASTLIYAVEIDENGNIVFGDDFIEAFVTYIINLMVEYYDSRERLSNNPDSQSALPWVCNINRGLMQMLGLGKEGDEYYAFDKSLVPEFINNLEKIFGSVNYSDGNAGSRRVQGSDKWTRNENNAVINPEYQDEIYNAIRELLNKFCENVTGQPGATSISLEQYYDALVSFGVPMSGYSNQTQTTTNNVSTDNAESHNKQLTNEEKQRALANDLKNKAPDIYEFIGSTLESPLLYDHWSGKSIYGDISSTAYVDTIYYGFDANIRGCDPTLLEVLKYAAGITDSSYVEMQGDEKRAQDAEKLRALFDKIGYSSNTRDLRGDIDVEALFNYLLGNNPEGRNYIAEYMEQKNSTTVSQTNQTNQNAAASNAPVNTNIPVTNYNEYIDELQTVENTGNNMSDLQQEITTFIKELFLEYGIGNYYYKGASFSDEIKNEIFDIINNKIIPRIMEKYSDVLTALSYDGTTIHFSTKYDKFELDGNYRSNYVAIPDGRNGYDGYHYSDWLSADRTIDKPVIYMEPKVIPNNIPDEIPASIDNEKLFKTAWNGILVSESGKLYIWDSKNQQYYYMPYSNYDVDQLVNGNINTLPWGMNNEMDSILLSLVYGFNRTESSNIFEKDGTYFLFEEKNTNRQAYNGSGICITECVVAGKSTDADTEAKAPVPTAEPSQSQEPAQAPVQEPTQEATQVSDSTPEEESFEPAELLVTAVEVEQIMNEAAEKEGLEPDVITSGVFHNPDNGKEYLWNPKENRFEEIDVSLRDNVEQKLQERQHFLKALLLAYINEYDFTANFPWECRDSDGNTYVYDKEKGNFIQK